MNKLKQIILFIVICCVALPIEAMDAGDGDQGYFGRVWDAAKDNPGVVFSVGALLGATVYVSKQMRDARLLYGSMYGPDIKQITVLDQFAGEEYGGGASCGYQALKNAIYIARLLLNKGAQADLTDLAIVQQLFNKTEPIGLWRKLVIENTYSRALKWKIDKVLYAYLIAQKNLNTVAIPAEVQTLEQKFQDRFKDKIRSYYQGVLGDELSAHLLNGILENLKDKPVITSTKIALDRSIVLNAIKKSERLITPDIPGLEHFDFGTYVKNDQTLDVYVPQIASEVHQMQELEISKSSAVQEYNTQNPANAFDVRGDWINEREIALLVAHERQPHGLLSDLSVPFNGITVIDNVCLLDQGEGEIGLIREIGKRLAKRNTFIHAFVVGLMSGKPGEEVGNRHWITLVVHKHDGVIEYSVADSGGNASRTRNGIIWTLIKHLAHSHK